ncbi:hypothetical protein A2U01_0063476, partial [Trifolium medium]|nr:hypothetical protein [Trifolium medium]
SRTTLPLLFRASTFCPSATPQNSGKVGLSSQSRYRSSRTKTQVSGAGMDTLSGSSREKKTLDSSIVRPVPSRKKSLQLAGKNQNK